MATIELSPETFESLQKMANERHLSINELANAALRSYILDQQGEEELTQEEITDLLEVDAETEADEAQGIVITHDNIKQMIDDMFAAHQQKQKRHSA